jgi:phosphohistidine phosphatase
MSMTPLLLLVRHAKAEDHHPLGDAARGLTPEGRDRFRQHARALRGVTEIRSIATSPLVRAVQTAEILAEALGISRIDVVRELAPGSPERIARFAQELRGWALVGHNPSLSEVARLLLDEPDLEEMKKGACLALGRPAESFSFLWLASPGRPLRRSLPL